MSLSVSDYLEFPIIAADERISYGIDAAQFGDLFLPATNGQPAPVLLLIHGGCWRAKYGLAQLGQLARALTQQGIAVWNIEYRRLGNGGGWPYTFQDVAAAADLLPELAPQFRLDLSRLLVMGHSAGGQLALWLAARHRLAADSPLYSPQPLPVTAVISLAGIPDMADAFSRRICDESAADLLGGEPAQVPVRYQAGSPRALLPLQVPHTHIVGELDQNVPLDHVAQFVKTAVAHGDDATLIPVAAAGHFEIVAAHTAAWDLVQTAVLEGVGL